MDKLSNIFKSCLKQGFGYKSLFWSILIVSFSLTASEPDWVREKTINTPNDYFGIGKSTKSKQRADNFALLEFSRMLGTKIMSKVFLHESENGKSYHQEATSDLTIETNEKLSGVSIKERYFDGETYFSLVHYTAEEYRLIREEQMKLDSQKIDMKIATERQKTYLKQEINQLKLQGKQQKDDMEIATERQKAYLEQKENQLKLQKENEQIAKENDQIALEQRKFKLKLQKKQQKDDQRRKKRALNLNKYGNFSKCLVPEKCVSIRTAQITKKRHAIMFKCGLYPMKFYNAYYAVRIKKMEISTNLDFDGFEIYRQVLRLKFQILQAVGDYYKISAAFGASQGIGKIDEEGYSIDQFKYTFFATSTLALPEFFYTFLTCDASFQHIGIGFNSYPFYNYLKDNLGFVLDFSVFPDSDFRNRNNDLIEIGAGIRLSYDFVSALLAYEERHDKFSVSMEYQF